MATNASLHVAFVIDVFARRIVGWRASATANATLVLDALEQAVHRSINALAETVIGLLKAEVIRRCGP